MNELSEGLMREVRQRLQRAAERERCAANATGTARRRELEHADALGAEAGNKMARALFLDRRIPQLF